jgi:hypothetical protein
MCSGIVRYRKAVSIRGRCKNQKVLWQAVKSASGRSMTNIYCGIDDAVRQWFSTCAQQKLDAEFLSEGRKKMTPKGGDIFLVEVGRLRVGYNQQEDFYIIFYVMLNIYIRLVDMYFLNLFFFWDVRVGRGRWDSPHQASRKL